MCLRMVLKASISLRGVPKAVGIVFSSYTALTAKKIPNYKTVRRWITRVGHYKLFCPLEQGDDWAVITDASIQIGKHKCLMVIGIRLSQLKKGKALSFEDFSPLVLEMHTHCNAQTVDAALRKARSRTGNIQLICSDQGSDIVCGVKLYQKDHPEAAFIPDITHKVALLLKHDLEDDSEWLWFCKKANKTKNRAQQTEFAHLSPPNQRSKCRFMNLEALVSWGKKILDFLEKEKEKSSNDSKSINKLFGWVCEFKNQINTWHNMLEVCQITRHLVRTEMIDHNIANKTMAVLNSLNLPERASQLALKTINFLQECVEKVPEGSMWIGTSEIIESLFGKLKHLERDQDNNGFTSFVLAAAACVGALDVKTINQAFCHSKNKDIVMWEQQNLGVTIQARRKQNLVANPGQKLTKVSQKTNQDFSGLQERDLAIAG
jgi:hypothetical protein